MFIMGQVVYSGFPGRLDDLGNIEVYRGEGEV